MKKRGRSKKTLIKYFKNAGYKKITTDTNLIENEILDSIGMFELVGFEKPRIKFLIKNASTKLQDD